MTANPPDRRASCLLCSGRCDPGKWTCRICHERLIRLIREELLSEVEAQP